MEYKSFLKVNIHQQFIRAYIFMALISIVLLVLSFFNAHETRKVLLLFSLNGLLMFLISAAGHGLITHLKKDISLIVNFCSYLFIIDLLIIENITCSIFKIPLTPVYVIAFLVLTLKLMYDQTAVSKKVTVRKNILSITLFMGSIALLDFWATPRFFAFKFPLFITSFKLLLAVTPYYFIVMVYNFVVNNYKAQIEQTEATNIKLMNVMRFVISGEMFASILHDMKNMVLVITNSIDMIKRKVANSIGEKQLNSIEKSVEEIRRISSVFINYIKMDGVKVEKIQAWKIVDNAVNFVMMSKEVKNNISFSKKFCEEYQSYTVLASEYRLFSVFLNILNNAVQSLLKADTTDKKVTVSIYKQNSYVEVSITDNGPGIKMEVLHKIFDIYTTKVDGSGLGLHLASNYISNELGGSIRVESEPNVATTFYISLPIAESLSQNQD